MQKKSKTDNTHKVNNIKRHATTVTAVALAVLWVIFELVVFFNARPTSPEVNFYEVCTEKVEGNVFEITGTKSLWTKGKIGAVETISFEAVKTEKATLASKMPKIEVYGTDPAVSKRILYTSKRICIGDDERIKTVVTLDVPENASEIILTFGHAGCDYTVTNIKINAADDVSFHFARCAIVLGVIALFYLCAQFGLWKVFFDGKKHGWFALAVCLICVIFALMLTSAINPNRAAVKYPLEKGVQSYNPYVQQFDALMKGQLHIDYEPAKELLELENPYDNGARSGIYYLWDRALYDGKYYSYFGMAPILTLYFPYYKLTGNLPADDTVSAVFTVLTALFLSMAAVKWASMRTKKVPLPLILIGTLSVLFSTQAFLVARGHSRFYYIATISSMAFLSMFIWLFLCGISGNIRLREPEKELPKWKKPLIFAFAGVAFGLCFLSRFNIALLAAFAIVPMLWFSVVTVKKDGEKRTIRPLNRVIPELVFLALPVIVAVGFQLWLNVTRFDSLFEFGTTYQLTVSDVSQNKIRLGDLPAALFHYFVHPTLTWTDPPIPSLYYTSLNCYGHYVYVDTGMGLFSIPLTWALLASVGIFASKKRSTEGKVTLASVLVGLVVLALLDFGLGGVIFRYTCDLTLIASFASMAIVYALCENVMDSGIESACRVANIAVVAIFLLSLGTSLGLALSENANLTPYTPEFCAFFRSLFGV